MQCLVPVMQLGLGSVRYISRALAQAGRQAWMERWLVLAMNAVCAGGAAALHVVKHISQLGGSGASKQQRQQPLC
jgi:hypothetical protein